MPVINLRKIKNIGPILIGAIVTGIALVIAESWEDAIKQTINIIIVKIKCSKYILTGKTAEYNNCVKDETLFGLYINAVFTSLAIYLVFKILFGNSAFKK